MRTRAVPKLVVHDYLPELPVIVRGPDHTQTGILPCHKLRTPNRVHLLEYLLVAQVGQQLEVTIPRSYLDHGESGSEPVTHDITHPRERIDLGMSTIDRNGEMWRVHIHLQHANSRTA
jgi:hypothetical protein